MPKPKFVQWMEFMDYQEPMFTAPDGSTVTGKKLLETYQLPLPPFPDLKTWHSLVEGKRKCRFCFASLKGTHEDLYHHIVLNHGRRAA